MRRADPIPHMLDLHERLKSLPPPRPRGFYTGRELATVIGRIPRHTDAALLRNLDWVRVARVVNGKLARCWVPPWNLRAVLDSKPT